MQIRAFLIALLFHFYFFAGSQCFINAPLEVCAGDCGPVFWLLNDPPGTTYAWSIDCGTITNPTAANPHTACFNTPGICRIDVLVTRPGQETDTCTTYTLVLPTTEEQLVEFVCFGDSVEVNGTYYLPGLYYDTIFGGNVVGCDSFLVILVAEIPPMYDTLAYVGCDGDGYGEIVNGTVYDQSNPSGTEYITDSTGCLQAIVEINFIYHPNTSDTLEYYEGCQGDGFSIVVNGVTYDESNPIWVEVLINSYGCDSVVTYYLTFHPVYMDTISYTGCSGDGFNVTVDSIVYDESNPTGIDTFATLEGCDSIIVIDLVFMPLGMDTISYDGCMGDGYSVVVNGITFNEENPTDTIIIVSSNCDSIIIVDLHFADCPDTLIVTGHELCVSGTGSDYTWYTCAGIPLADTTQCITIADTGCICVTFTDGTGYDTLCLTYNLCDLSCDISAPDQVCPGDSVLITFSSNDSTLSEIDWTIMLDSFATQHFTGTDSLWMVYTLPGCYTIELTLQDSGCVTICTDTICIPEIPTADLCCHNSFCDSAFLSVNLTGQPPFTVAITDGTTIDTISGIDSFEFEYPVYPPFFLNTLYTLLWVQDSSSNCYGNIIDDSAYVYLITKPELTIVQNGNTLCIEPSGFAYNWTDCETPATVSPGQCFTPTASGCYCAYVTTNIIGCSDSECIDFVLTDIEEPNVDDPASIWYDPDVHSIFIQFRNTVSEDLQFQLFDVQGRVIPFMEKEQIQEGLFRITLEDNTPNMVIASVYSQKFRFTRGVFVPD